MADSIKEAAENVLRGLGMWRLPVNPLQVAKEEGIELAPSHYGSGFDARIEYLPDFDRFAIYYQDSGLYRNPGRVNFSLGHELGHYYLPEHRQRLRAGKEHNSVCDFGSKDPVEREADRFSANFLMPEELFIAKVNEFRGGFCTLKDLCTLAGQLGTSITSTAIRYCDCGIDATLAVISSDRIVQWTWPSEDMRRLSMYFIEYGSMIPSRSRTAALYDRRDDGQADDRMEGRVDSSVWFKWPKRPEVWEEAMFLGDRVLTYLAASDK